MQLDLGLLTLAYCPLLLNPSFLCSIVSIAVPSSSCQLPSCDLFTSLALLSSFGRETSLVKITGPRSIFTSLFTPLVYFQSLLSVPLLSLALILCKQQGRRNLQLLCTRWEQRYLYLCAGPGEVSNLGCERRHCSLYRLLVALGVLLVRYSTLASSLREICCFATSPLLLGVTNEKKVRCSVAANFP